MKATNILLPGGLLSEASAHGVASTLFEFDFSTPALLNAAPLSITSVERWQVEGHVRRDERAGFDVREGGGYLFASCAVETTDESLRAVSRERYQALLRLVEDAGYPRLVRFWNYVPRINDGEGDLEPYRQFCWGRAEALDGCAQPLPAASGTGSADSRLYISVLAARPEIEMSHFENPRQISAYHYPRQYGPRSPSFARATLIGPPQQPLYLISGTASIVNHETLHEGQLCAQLEETRRNIDALAGQVEGMKPIAVRCYLRYPEQTDACLDSYARHFSGYPQPAMLHSALCRRELLAELEMVMAPAV